MNKDNWSEVSDKMKDEMTIWKALTLYLTASVGEDSSGGERGLVVFPDHARVVGTHMTAK